MKVSFNYVIFIFCLFAFSLSAHSQDKCKSISNIERHGEWYRIYDDKGKEVKDLYVSSVGELIGVSSNHFIMKRGVWIDLYNAYCKKYKSLYAPSIGTIISVNDNAFVARRSCWEDTYYWTGKKKFTRYAR